MKKIFIGLITLIGLIVLVMASSFTPQGNIDLRDTYNITNGVNATFTYLNGNLSWSYLNSYPVACPGSGAITTLGDSVTCSDLWVDVAGDTWTGNMEAGNNNLTNVSYIGIGTKTPTHELNVVGEANITGNVTADYFLGEGFIGNWLNITGDVYFSGNGVTILDNNLIINEDMDVRNVDLMGSLMSSTGAVSVTDDLNVTGNLTIGEKITFTFGEIIDNIVDGWIKITGSLQVSENLNVTGNTTIWENLNVTGNCTCENVHLPSYLSTHTNVSITAVGGVWLNVTFDVHDDAENARLTHTYNNATNDTFTIVDTGVYRLSYGISYLDSHAAVKNHIAIRLIKDNTEIEGSVFEKDTNLQNAIGTIYRNVMASLTAGEEIKLQFVSNSTTVSMQTQANYGDHPTSANLNIHRIS